MDLPVYELKFIDNESNDLFISFVNSPAIQEDFFYFSEEEKDEYKFSDDEQMIVSGTAMIPNKKIYRKNLNGYVYFTQESINKFAEMFLNKNTEKFNIDHKEEYPNVKILESYFAKENNEFNVPVGSLIISAKINDKELWNSIKNGDRNGFSIEGLAQSHLVKFEIEYKKENNTMNLKEKLENGFKTLLMSMFEDEKEEFATDVTGDTGSEVVGSEVVGSEVVGSEDESKQEDLTDTAPEGSIEDKPMEHITKDEVQSMLDELLSKIEEKINNKVAMTEEKIEKFGENLQPLTTEKENIQLNKYQQWKADNK